MKKFLSIALVLLASGFTNAVQYQCVSQDKNMHAWLALDESAGTFDAGSITYDNKTYSTLTDPDYLTMKELATYFDPGQIFIVVLSSNTDAFVLNAIFEKNEWTGHFIVNGKALEITCCET